MAITRKYETKEECVELFARERFDNFPSWTVTDQDDFLDSWEFEGIRDGEDASYEDDDSIIDTYGLTHPPMWSTWFIPADSWIDRWIDENRETVAECGFTIISHDGELFAIGIDGAGYSFIDTHWTRLYDAMDLTWHE